MKAYTLLLFQIYSSLQMDPVLNYTEDSGPMFLIPQNLQDDFFFIAPMEFNVGYRVTLTIVTGSNDDPGQLILPNGFSDNACNDVTISAENTSQITVESMYSFSSPDSVPLDCFDAVFKAVRMLFRDNASRRYTNVA